MPFLKSTRSSSFSNFCSTHKISHQITKPHPLTPPTSTTLKHFFSPLLLPSHEIPRTQKLILQTMPNPRKRPRMPKLPLQQTTPISTPAHIKLRPPPRIPSLRHHIPDPIHTPNFTPCRASPTQEPVNSPLPNQSPIQSPRPRTPVLPIPHTSHRSHRHRETPSSLSKNGSDGTPSEWSGGLFSAHRPLTLDTLHPTPPTDRTDVTHRIPVEAGDKQVGESYDARVRRLSFGGDISTGRDPVVLCQPTREHVHCNPRIPHQQRKRRLSESGKNDAQKTRRRRRSIPDERHVTQDRYWCSQIDDIEPVGASPLGACLSEAGGEVLIPETPLPLGSIHNRTSETPLPRGSIHNRTSETPLPRGGVEQNRTPETAARRCRAPIWNGQITQIPETPMEQLPPREAPVYVVRTAITASMEPPSLELSSGERQTETSEKRGERRMGLLWLDIGGDSVRESGDDTRLGEDSDSASTEPPSPTRKESDIVPYRAQVFCRSLRVSIPAGGFRSPSPEPSLTNL